MKEGIQDENQPVPLIEVTALWKVFGECAANFDHDPENNEAMELLLGKEDNGTVCAVHDVSFKVNKGELFVIMGLSGSGKSTLIRCLARLIEPTAGQIRIDSQSVTEMSAQELTAFRRSKVAMVFQHYALLPHRTVLENVAFGLKLRGEKQSGRQKKALAIINKVGLSGWEKHYPAQLSGGMQQRAGLARALVQNTAILLMDEPFSGLDPLIRREMQDELLRLQKELRKTIIFVTHDLNEALRLGERMAVMNEGRFVQVGTPREIARHPADEYVRRFVQSEGKLFDPPKNKTKPEQHRDRPLRKETQENISTGSY
jgi:glycine betaine/proline transport system ATP-binding protein